MGKEKEEMAKSGHSSFPLPPLLLSFVAGCFGFCLLPFGLRVRRALRSLRPVFRYRLVSVLGPGPWPSLTRQTLPGVRQRLASALSNRLHSLRRSLRAKESLSPKRLKSRTLCWKVHDLGFEPWFRSSSRRSSWRPYPRPSRGWSPGSSMRSSWRRTPRSSLGLSMRSSYGSSSA